MDLRGWVVTCVDGMRLVGCETRAMRAAVEHGAPPGSVTQALSPVYELRVDCVALPAQVTGPKGPMVLPMPQIVRQLLPVHCSPSITIYPLPEDARLISLESLSESDQRDYVKLIEDVRASMRREESGLVVPR